MQEVIGNMINLSPRPSYVLKTISPKKIELIFAKQSKASILMRDVTQEFFAHLFLYVLNYIGILSMI